MSHAETWRAPARAGDDTTSMRSIEYRLLGAVLQKYAHNVVAPLVNALCPLCCVFCGVETRCDERYLCEDCCAELPWIVNACPSCATAIASAAKLPCADCQRDPPPFAAVVAPLEYAFPIDAAIKAMKFQRKLHYLPLFREILVMAAKRLPDDIDAIMPVPLHRWRQLKRGFNQASELAVPLKTALSVPMIDPVVRQVRTPYQSGLDAKARTRNLKRAFGVKKVIVAQHVLIVDDVITTGATCRQLAGVLKRSGVSKVSVLALARA